MSGERMPFPTNADVIRSLIERHADGVYTAFVATLQGYSAETQTADCVPLIQHPYNDPEGSGFRLLEDLPVIPSVAVIQPRSRGAFLSMPVADGDTVLCIVATQDIGTWRRSTEPGVVTPRDTRRNHIGHAIALVGLYKHHEHLRAASIGAADVLIGGVPTPGIVLGFDVEGGTRLLMKPDGSVEITQGATVVVRVDPNGIVHVGGVAGDFLALAGLVKARLDAIQTWSSTHTHTGVTTGPGTSGTAVGLTGSNEVAATKAKGV